MPSAVRREFLFRPRNAVTAPNRPEMDLSSGWGKSEEAQSTVLGLWDEFLSHCQRINFQEADHNLGTH